MGWVLRGPYVDIGDQEALGNGTILGFSLSRRFEPPLFMILAPGALLTIGF